jgi:hypothetical protein
MAMKIIGVHPVDAPEPCHIIEVELTAPDQEYDWGTITQEIEGQPRDNWQAPWDEQQLGNLGGRCVFFFHYLDHSKPLITPDGPKELPLTTSLPDHLKEIKYEEP